MGSSDADTQADDDEQRQHELYLPTYAIGKTPVTNAQWRHFVAAGGYEKREYWTGLGGRFISGNERESVRERLARAFQRRPRPVFVRSQATGPQRWNGPQQGGDNLPVVNISWFEAVATAAG